MNRRTALSITGLLLAVPVVVVTVSQAQSNAPKFQLETPGVAFQDDQLLVAVPLKNVGGATAVDVTVNRILLGPGNLEKPGSLPLPLGDIPVGTDIKLQLAFSNVARNGRPPLIVIGSFSYNGRTQSFQANLALPMPGPDSSDAKNSIEVETPPQIADGAIYPPAPPFVPFEANEEEEDFPLPEGKLIGNLMPDNPSVDLPPDVPIALADQQRARAKEVGRLAANDPVGTVRLGTMQVQGNPSSYFPWDPSGASVDVQVGERVADRLVFLTGNTYALLSTNGGGTFTKLDPTTIFPNDFDGGLCCDQVVQYVPSINRVIWFMQFRTVPLFDANGQPILNDEGKQKKGRNRIRIASASPAQVINSGGTSWTYWDMTAYGTFNFGNGWVDYPDMSYTNSYLHISIDLVGTGLFVIRCPLSEIQNSQTLHIRYTHPEDGKVAYGSHMTQDSTDAAYWFGQVTTSSLRVFEWKDNSNSYSWRTLNVNSWKNSDYVSKTKNNVDWLSFGFGRSQVRGATVVWPDLPLGGGASARLMKIAWSAARGGGFAQPYVRLLDVAKVSVFGITAWSAGNDKAIWNSNFAFQHPYMTTNANREVGINVAYGGPSDWPTPLVGFVGDSTMYFANKSTTAIGRWGDYSAIRKHPNNPKLFSTSDYFLRAPNSDFPNGQVVHQYRLWGRAADIP